MDELERVFIKTIKSGKYTGTLEWYKREGILIDNCFRSVVKDETGEIVKIIDKKRPIPDKIRPDIIVPPPMEGARHLYYFTPGYLSPMCVFKPPLKKPVVAWVVRAETGTFVYDAETGEKIGEEVPPPSAFCTSALHKPWGFGTKEYDAWANYRKNAVGWFKKMGIEVEEYLVPLGLDVTDYWAKEETKAKLRNNNLKYCYIAAHTWRAGKAAIAYNTIGLSLAQYLVISAQEIRECLKDREPMWVAFLASCHGMDQGGKGPLSEAFRKGKMRNTVTIGYKNMTDAKGNATPGWGSSFGWQDDLFRNVYEGKTWKDAFDLACASYPKIVNNVVFYGDTTMRLVPTTAPEPPKEAEFYLSEIVEDHLPEWITGYACAGCTGIAEYKCPTGYTRTECQPELTASHGCPSYATVKFVKCEREGVAPPPLPPPVTPAPPKKSVITFKSEPTGAELRLKKH